MGSAGYNQPARLPLVVVSAHQLRRPCASLRTLRDALTTVAFLVVLIGAGGRGVGVVVGQVHTLLRRQQFRTFRFGWAELVTWIEPFLLGAATCVLARSPRSAASGTALLALVAGAILVLCGYGLLFWAIWSWPALFTGHAILPDHQLVRMGVYGVVRHPAYLAAFVIWLGLGIAFRSVGVVALTALYVIPAYLAYIRSEEKMMREEFGDTYREYCRDVPGLIPRLR